MLLALPLLVAAAAFQAAGAQGVATVPAPSCLDALPPGELTRVPVYVEVVARDTAASGLTSVADLLAGDVAARMRAMLGAAGGELPVGEPTFGWRDLEPSVFVTLRRDGSFAWAPDSASDASFDLPYRRAAGDSLVSALAAVHGSGGRYPLPQGSALDSARFEMRLVRQGISRAGRMEPRSARAVAPVFSVAAPWESPVELVRPPRISYPTASQNAGTVGVVILRYVVDTTGRVDPATVREIWPEGLPRLKGELRRHYQRFLRSVIRGLDDARFEPGRAGGCVVHTLVQQPFEFNLR